MDAATTQAEMIATLRELTLQLMLIAAGVFGIVGGFISSSEKQFSNKGMLLFSLTFFALSALCGYVIHGAIITLLAANKFDAHHVLLQTAGILQIGSFLLGGALFIWFISRNISAR